MFLGKGTGLASYNTYTGNPGFVTEDLKNTIAVTKEDVMRVYNQYLKNKNYIATSFVPKNAADLAFKRCCFSGCCGRSNYNGS